MEIFAYISTDASCIITSYYSSGGWVSYSCFRCCPRRSPSQAVPPIVKALFQIILPSLISFIMKLSRIYAPPEATSLCECDMYELICGSVFLDIKVTVMYCLKHCSCGPHTRAYHHGKYSREVRLPERREGPDVTR